MVIDWIRLMLEQNKAIISIVLLLLGVSGFSIYGNVNEINPWKAVEEFVDKDIYEEPVLVLKESPIPVKPVVHDYNFEELMESHIEEYH